METPSLFDQTEHKSTSRHHKKGGGLSLGKLLVVVGVGATFLGVLIYALLMRDDIRSASVDVPLISAPDIPVKRRPDQPGGMDFPNKDKRVFNLLDEEIRQADAQADKIAAVVMAETPELPDASAEPEPKATPAEEPVAEPEVKAEKAAAPAHDAIASLVKESPAPTAKPEPAPAPVMPKPPVTGEYGVQLASFVTQKDAETSLKTYMKKYPSFLGHLTGDVQSVDIGQGRGMRYRARFIGLESLSAARNLCAQLKAKQQGCLVIKR